MTFSDESAATQTPRSFFDQARKWLTVAAGRSQYALVSRLFLSGLAVVYAMAFASLAHQIIGLIGHDGILPAQQLMQAAHERIPGRFDLLPTLAWWRVDDAFLLFLCHAGVILSVLAFFQLAPTVVFFLLWLLYLSLCSIGGDFLSFQWDILLLESGFWRFFFHVCAGGDGRRDGTSPAFSWYGFTAGCCFA